MRESNRPASKAMSFLSCSQEPRKLTWMRIRATFSCGRTTFKIPSRAILTGLGTSMTRPSSRLIRVGTPQPSLAIGPKTNLSANGGKICRRSLIKRWALATISCGKSTEARALVLMPSRSTSILVVRFRPNRPPTPLRVKPKPSWMGVNSAVIRINRLKPSLPSGRRVVRRPMALSENNPWNSSSRAPA